MMVAQNHTVELKDCKFTLKSIKEIEILFVRSNTAKRLFTKKEILKLICAYTLENVRTSVRRMVVLLNLLLKDILMIT